MLWTEVPGQPGPLATCPESAAPALGGAQRAAAGVGTCRGHGARRAPPPPRRVWGPQAGPPLLMLG